MKLTKRLKVKLESRLKEVCEQATKIFGIDLSNRTILYRKIGYSAASAYIETQYDDEGYEVGFECVLTVSPILYPENVEKFLAITIAHEVAHFIIFIQYDNKKRPPNHGKEWKAVMKKLGVFDTTYHKYNVDTIKRMKDKKAAKLVDRS
jgi:predicted SprT family Zn-dependent metalloprotease